MSGSADETPAAADPVGEVAAEPTKVARLTAEPKPEEGVCSVELEEFEGPLDLLLHLVRRHELDILDIPIAFVCEKYLEYIEVMRALDLEIAGDYLVMAATLAFLKSRELVPPDPMEEGLEGSSEDGPDPREELISRLLQYQKFSAAAEELDRLPVSGRDTFNRGQPVDLPPLDAGLAPITLYRLAEAYHRVLERARILKSHEVVMETVSVATRMEQLTLILVQRERVDFEALFLERTWSSEQELRSMLVVTLMSILELVRLGVARVHQPEGAVSLTIERAATAEEARRVLADYDESLSFGTPKPKTEASDASDVSDEAPLDELDETLLAEAVEEASEAVERPPMQPPGPAPMPSEPAPIEPPEPSEPKPPGPEPIEPIEPPAPAPPVAPPSPEPPPIQPPGPSEPPPIQPPGPVEPPKIEPPGPSEPPPIEPPPASDADVREDAGAPTETERDD